MMRPIIDDDMAGLFRARRMASNDKRASNRDYSTNLLRERGVAFTAHNGGSHLIVGKWDFWPSTGRWRERRAPGPGLKLREGRGVEALLELIAKESAHG